MSKLVIDVPVEDVEPEYPYFAKFGATGLVFITGHEQGVMISLNACPEPFKILGKAIDPHSFAWGHIERLPKGTTITITV